MRYYFHCVHFVGAFVESESDGAHRAYAQEALVENAEVEFELVDGFKITLTLPLYIAHNFY